MVLLISPTRLLKTSFIAALALVCSYNFSPAQTLNLKQPETSEEKAEDESDKATETKPELTDEEKKLKEERSELDILLLGPWAFLADSAQVKPTEKLIGKAVTRCLEIPKLKKLDIEPSAARKLPDAKNMFGDLIYFRTDKGLQRFHIQTGRMLLLNEFRKFEKSGKTAWAVRGRVNGYTLRFADTKKNGGKGQFMLENNNLYLRCKIAPPPAQTTDN